MKKDLLSSSIIGSLKKANRKYERWSGGAWLNDYGVETVLVAHIAEALLKTARLRRPDACLTLEESFEAIEFGASLKQKKLGRKPDVLRGKRRADIVLWSNPDTAWGVVEVKRDWVASGCARDLDRLSQLLNHFGQGQGGCLRYACLAVFMSQIGDRADQKLVDRYDRIEANVSAQHENLRVHRVQPYRYNHEGFRSEVGVCYGGGLAIELS